MFPIIYPWTETEFKDRGYGVLSDCVECLVYEELNGEYTLELTCLNKTDKLPYLQIRNIIVVSAGSTYAPQAFRIHTVNRSLSNYIIVYARHISYDLSGYLLSPIEDTFYSAAQALQWFELEAHLENNYMPFELHSTVKTTGRSWTMNTPRSVKNGMAGEEGSIIDVFGGEWFYDNFQCYHLPKRGLDSGVRISYGVNLAEYEKESISDLFTHIVAYYTDVDGICTVGGCVRTKASIPNYVNTLIIDASGDFEETPTQEELTEYARNYSAGHNLISDIQTIVITPALLEDQNVSLGDVVHVCYGDEITDVRVVATTWDALADKYTQIELGTKKQSIADVISELGDSDFHSYGSPVYTAVTGKPTSNQTPAFGGTVTISQISQDTSGQISATDRTIKIPNTTASTTSSGLMSAGDKTKLDGIEAGAEVNPTYTAVTGKPTGNQTPAFGGVATVSQVSQSTTGQVSVTDRTIKIPNTTATTTAAGLMSAGDKTKLEGIEAGAQVNPTYTAVTGKPTGNQTPAFGAVATVSQVSQNASGQVSVTDRTIKIPNTEATTAAAGLMSADDKFKLNFTNIVYATCSTAADTAAKVATISGNTEFALQTGAIVGVKFSATNTAQNPTLNVGGTGAKSIYYNTAVITTGSLGVAGHANRVIYYMYDGTNWCFMAWGYDTNTTYSAMSQAEFDAGTSTTARLVTPKLLREWIPTFSEVTGKPTANQTPGFGSTFTISQISQDENGQISATDRTVKIPNTTASTTSAGLMSAGDKTKLDGIEAGAEVNPTYTAVTGKPTGNQTPAFGGVATVSQVKQAVDGQVSVTDRTIKIPDTEATTTTHGLMSAGDKTKLNGVEEGAEVNPTFTATTGKPTGNLTPSFGGTATISQVKQATSGQLTVTDRTIKIPDTEASTSSHGLMSADDKTKLNYTNVAYGTCDTAAGTAAKVITISGNTKFALQAGAIVGIKFDNTNTAASPTLNVGGTGAKSIKYQATAPYTSGNWVAGQAGYVNYYMYDGTYWVFISQSQDRNTTYSAMSQTEADTGTATTARSITAKVLNDTIKSKVGTPAMNYFIQDLSNLDAITATYHYSNEFTLPAGYWVLSVAVEWSGVTSTADVEEFREAVLLKASDLSAPGIISYDRVVAISKSVTYNRFVFPVKLTSATAYKVRLRHNSGSILSAKVRAYWIGLET